MLHHPRLKTGILCLLALLLPAHNLNAQRSYIPEVLAGTAIAGFITLLGVLGWKSMTNSHLERQQKLAYEHDEQEKRVLDDVAAIGPQVQFDSLLCLIANNESVDTIAAFCLKQNMNADCLARSIAAAKYDAYEAYARLQSHAESWNDKHEYTEYYQRAMMLLENKTGMLVQLDHLHSYFETHRDYVNLYQTYYTIDAHSYVFTKDPFDLIHAVDALDQDIKTLQYALSRVTCRDLHVHDSSCLLMLNQAAQKIARLKQTRDNIIQSREYPEQLCHKLLAEQKEKELAIQRELVEAQNKQAQAMIERVRLEEKNYQRRINDLHQRIIDLYDYLHTQQNIITSLEIEISKFNRLYGRDAHTIAELAAQLHQLQQQIHILEQQYPAETLTGLSW